MSMKDKIKYIEGASLSFRISRYDSDYSHGMVALSLFNKGLINKQKMVKLKLIGEKTNFASNYWLNEELNS